jgi:hypothetical protein
LKDTIRKIGFAVLVLTISLGTVAADEWHFENADRIVAFSDVHGAYDAMVETLQSAKVIDASLSWSGGKTHLVLVGDILDRGPDSRAAMDLLMVIEQEAIQAGGQVHVLMGNHEVMNLIGDIRYVARQEYAAFADDELPEDREFWFEAYRSKRADRGAREEELLATFDSEFPAGFFAHRKAFAPDGKYGAWLLIKPLIVVVNSTAFVHGGLSPMVAETGLQGINGDLVDDISLYAHQLAVLFKKQLLLPTDSNRDHVDILNDLRPNAVMTPSVAEAVADIRRLNGPLFSYQSPHWYRGHLYCGEILESERIDAALQKISASRVVVGHTPTANREIMQRLDGRVIEVDTGMLNSYYKGSGHALVIEDGNISAVSQDGSATLQPIVSGRRVGARPEETLSVEEMEDLLENGRIISVGYEDGELVQVTNGEHTVDATFIPQARSGVYPDVAGYRLDRLLKLDMVPVTVIRRHNDKQGSLRFVPIRTMDERQRQLENTGGGAWCPLPAQWSSMMIFDALIGLKSRAAESLLYNLNSWQVMLVNFDHAFTTSASKPNKLTAADIKIGSAWQAGLKSLDNEQLEETFSDVLDKRRIKALAKRRELLLNL